MKYVYILKAGEDRYKVGISTNVTRRVSAIQTSNGHRVYIVSTKLCEDAQGVERKLHAKLKAMGSGGGTEWFRLEPEDVLRLCIWLHSEPEIDVYANVDLNKQLVHQNLRHKTIEKKLDVLINIAQRPRATIFKTGEEIVVSEYKPTREMVDAELLDKAIAIIKEKGKASTSLLQRKLSIGYGRAARMIETLEEQGVIGGQEGIKAREVLIEH